MKKQYIAPNMRAHKLKINQMMRGSLTSSPLTSGGDNDEGEAPLTGQTKKSSLWSEDESEDKWGCR